MHPIPKKSLLLRLGLAMGVITALAFVSMLSSVFIADTSEGFAAAINQAGTLRMQSYRIASSLVHSGEEARWDTRELMDEFERRLESARIVSVLGKGADERLEVSYREVETQWRRDIRPTLERYVHNLERVPRDAETMLEVREARGHYLDGVDAFVADVDHLVNVLELEAEAKVRRLRVIQLVSLLLTLPVVILALFLLQARVLVPLGGLLEGARAARRGDFSVRIDEPGEDELGQLGNAFNVMAEDLSQMYAALEQRVREKTADLERSNRSLELLYRTTRRLGDASPNREVMEALIRDIEELMGVGSGTVCLGHPGDNQAFKLASTSIEINEGRYFEGAPDCARCMGDGTAHVIEVNGCDGCEEGARRVFSTPIRDQEQQFGVLLVEVSDGGELETWQRVLLETVANHIAFAFNASQRTAQNRMLALLEERNVIARELHDSLAQSLSYLKIQVSRLDRAIEREEVEATRATSTKLRDGLNGAYRQLRELLTTFRLRATEAGLGAALEETAEEYRERAGIEIELNNRIANCKFSPHEQIHVVQILREALSNISRHSGATRASIHLLCALDGRVTLRVEDDGVGLPEAVERLDHYGLSIMQERAEGLGGEVALRQGDDGGTVVELTFVVADARR